MYTQSFRSSTVNLGCLSVVMAIVMRHHIIAKVTQVCSNQETAQTVQSSTASAPADAAAIAGPR